LPATVLFVPGLRDHVADHWQTLLAAELPGSRTVAPLTENKLSRSARVEALDAAIKAIEGPLVLVAHSAGCLTTAHWAQTAMRPISGALLVTPPDIDFPLPEGYPTPEELKTGGWLPVPRWPLPFPTFVCISQNDPLGAADRVTGLAEDWRADVVDLGEVGHMNPAAGFGPWPEGLGLIDSLTRAVAL
jgi:predicted alpha/beta hydrolase family esterase